MARLHRARCAAPLLAAALTLLMTPPVSARIGPLKFKLWFSQWEDNALNGIISDSDQCAEQVNDYWTDSSTYPWKCQRALDCVLEHTSPSMTQLISSSLVLLGLTPTMLATLGPNIAESSMLALERPTLSLLLSIGSPAVAVSRILSYNDPFQAMKPSPNNDMFLPNRYYRWWSRREHRWIIIAIEYIVAFGAIANIVYTSINLGFRSVSSYDCESMYFPLLWVLVPGIIHAIGVTAFLFTPRAIGDELSSTCGSEVIGHAEHSDEGRAWRPGTTTIIYTEAPTRWTIVLQSIATGFAVGHVVFGTMVFSSLLFLLVSDSIPIILQYAASAVACRFVSQFELARMSKKYRIEHVKVLSPDQRARRIFLSIPSRND